MTGGVERLKLTHQDYRDYQAVSQSDLKSAYSNPQLYWETHIAKTRPKAEPSDVMQWGTDCEAFLRYGYLQGVLEIPDDVLNEHGHRRGKRWTEFAAACPAGKRLLKRDEFAAAVEGFQAAYRNIQDHAVSRVLVDEALEPQWQQQLRWYDAEHDLPMKCEIDILRDDLQVIVDVKTAHDTHHESFQRKVVELGYDIQAAHYVDAVWRLTGHTYAFAWVVIRNRPPYDVEVFDASDELLSAGEQRLLERIEWFRLCRDTGVWRSPTHGLMQSLYPPRWLKGIL